MSDDVKVNLIWGTVIAIAVLTVGGLIWQGSQTSHQNKVTCIQNGGTWIGGGGHCIQQLGGSNDG